MKQGDALSPLLFNFALEYAIRRVHVNQDGLKLNGTYQLLDYADDVNVLGGSVHTVKKNAEALVAATKEIGLEVNADKTKYMTVFRDQNAGRIHSMKMDNSYIERVVEFKYLGTTLRGVHRVLVGKAEGKWPLGRPRRRWEDNIKMDLQDVGGGGDWMELAQDRDRWRALVNTVMNFRVP